MRDDEAYLEDILEAITRIEKYAGKGREAYLADERRRRRRPPGPAPGPCGLDPDNPGTPGDLGCDAYPPCE